MLTVIGPSRSRQEELNQQRSIGSRGLVCKQSSANAMDYKWVTTSTVFASHKMTSFVECTDVTCTTPNWATVSRCLNFLFYGCRRVRWPVSSICSHVIVHGSTHRCSLFNDGKLGAHLHGYAAVRPTNVGLTHEELKKRRTNDESSLHGSSEQFERTHYFVVPRTKANVGWQHIRDFQALAETGSVRATLSGLSRRSHAAGRCCKVTVSTLHRHGSTRRRH